MRFDDKVVFITGAASGIGKNCALEFAKRGARLALSDWKEKSGVEACQELRHMGFIADFYHLDVSNYPQVKAILENVVNDFGRIDIAVNNAGVGASTPAKTADHALEDWDHVIAVNQSGVFYCMKEELRHMSHLGSGSIVNISSIAGIRGLPNQLAYTASKHAVIGMTKTAALEYARKGIRVNAVCPVFTNSPMLEELFQSKEGLREKLLHTIPLGRYGEVGDITNAILWLSHEQTSFVTGLHLPVDGGQTA